MARKSKAAYFLVDTAALPPEVIEDASAGGRTYGVRIVEEVHNGGARAVLFGVYYGEDEEKWDEAKKELGIDDPSETLDTDAAGRADAAGQIPNGRDEAFLRQAAEQKVAADAERMRTAEDEEVRKVLEGEGNAPAADSPNRQEPNVNIADATLAADRKTTPTNKAKR